MVKTLVGYRFCPTGEELINYYLKNNILGKTWLVEEAISEINISSEEPILLPSLAQIQSDDPIWYFFSPKEYTSDKKKVTKRTTGSGYWKVTGVDRKIRDKRRNGVEIGIEKILVYYEGKVPQGVWTPWVMHEYHITSLPPPPNHKSTYVICQVMYKGEEGEISNGYQLSESSHSLFIDPNTVAASMMKKRTEKKGLIITEDVMENMNSPFLCLINIAIGLILLLGLSLAISNRVY